MGLVVILCSIPIQGQHSDAGTNLFPLLNLDYDARSAAMAGASVAIPNSSNGVFSNPASTAFIDKIQLFFGIRAIMDNVWGGPVAFTYPFKRAGVFSIHLAGVTSGDIDVIEEDRFSGDAVYTGDVARDNYITGGVSWAYLLSNELAIGVSAKGLYNKINLPDNIYSALGGALDVGIQYRILRGRFITGAVLRNAGFVIHGYEEKSYSLPLELEVGISYVPRYFSTLRLAMDVNKKRGDYMNFEPALEFDLFKKIIDFRLGYTFSERDFGELINKIQGDQADDYIKSNWTALCIGVGVNPNIDKVDLNMDFALQFRTDALPPSLIVSALLEF